MLKHPNTILVAIPDSKHAEYVFNWVLTNVLQKETIAETKLVAMAVQSSKNSFYYFDPSLINAPGKPLFAEHSSLLSSFRKQVLDKFSDAKVETLQPFKSTTHAADAIIDYAKTYDVDIVYFGCSSGKLLVGSDQYCDLGHYLGNLVVEIDQYCSDRLQCPVMRIKHPLAD